LEKNEFDYIFPYLFSQRIDQQIMTERSENMFDSQTLHP